MKQLHLYIFILFAIGSVCFTVGCDRAKRPADLPKLYPCSITLKQDGKPATGVSVTLLPEEKILEKWPSAGLTDNSGCAKLVTYGQFKGVPSGKYKVLLGKTETKGEDVSEDTPLSKRPPIIVYSLVELKYTDREKTPLTLTVDNKSISEDFDIGSAVRIIIDKMIPGKTM